MVAVLISPGCAYNYTFRTSLPKSSAEPITQVKHIGVWGWVSSDEPFDLEAACPAGVAEFGSYVSFLNWLPGFFTIPLIWKCLPPSASPAASGAPGASEVH